MFIWILGVSLTKKSKQKNYEKSRKNFISVHFSCSNSSDIISSTLSILEIMKTTMTIGMIILFVLSMLLATNMLFDIVSVCLCLSVAVMSLLSIYLLNLKEK